MSNLGSIKIGESAPHSSFAGGKEVGVKVFLPNVRVGVSWPRAFTVNI